MLLVRQLADAKTCQRLNGHLTAYKTASVNYERGVDPNRSWTSSNNMIATVACTQSWVR